MPKFLMILLIIFKNLDLAEIQNMNETTQNFVSRGLHADQNENYFSFTSNSAIDKTFRLKLSIQQTIYS